MKTLSLADYFFGLLSGVIATFIGSILITKYEDYILSHRSQVEWSVLVLVSIILQGILALIRIVILKKRNAYQTGRSIKKNMTIEELETLRKKLLS